MTIKELTIRFENLEKAFWESQKGLYPLTDYASRVPQIAENVDANTIDISDNRDGLMETFETGITNTDDIATLREGLEEVYEMLLESEEK